jgi:hypothetical protein
VHNGTFANVDDATAQAARLPLREIGQAQSPAKPSSNGMGSIGAMKDAADELDAIVADAMKRRREEPWRTIPGE